MAEKKTVRKWKLTKDKTEPIIALCDEIMETQGIRVLGIKRNGDDFELTFDRDLTKEDAAKINAIRNLVQTRFPDHGVKEVEEVSS